MSPIEIRFLSGKVLAFSEPVMLPDKEAQLLFTIASGDPVIHVERLLDQMWPDADGDAAHTCFRVCLHRLRKHLRHSTLVERVHNGYALLDEVTVDLHDVRALLSGKVDVPALRVLFDEVRDGRVARQALGDWFLPFEAMLVEYQHKAACLVAEAALQDGDAETASRYALAVLRDDAINVHANAILYKCNAQVTLQGS